MLNRLLSQLRFTRLLSGEADIGSCVLVGEDDCPASDFFANSFDLGDAWVSTVEPGEVALLSVCSPDILVGVE
jgi:hypothetical protein